jgi:hypothetical protein
MIKIKFSYRPANKKQRLGVLIGRKKRWYD